MTQTGIMRRLAIALVLVASLGGCDRAVALVKGQMPVVAGTLEGGLWLVEDLNGGGMIDNARIDLTFTVGDQGRGVVGGRSGCNRYRGAWRQSGSTVELGPLAGTKMGCPPALMQLEQKFLGTLEAVTTVTYEDDGSAMLKAPDGRIITIRREDTLSD